MSSRNTAFLLSRLGKCLELGFVECGSGLTDRPDLWHKPTSMCPNPARKIRPFEQPENRAQAGRAELIRALFDVVNP